MSFLSSRWRRVLPVAGAAAAAAALTLAGTTLAAASGSPNAQQSGHAEAVRPAASANSECQALWAVVNSDGSLARAGCPGTSSHANGAGNYDVIFPRNIRSCAYQATIGEPYGFGSISASEITMAGDDDSVDGVYVATYNSSGAVTSEPFHVSVSCAPQDRAGRVKVSWPHKSVSVSITGGVSSKTVVVATVASSAGIVVTGAVPHVSSGKATIYLSRAPSPGHPVWVSWIAAH